MATLQQRLQFMESQAAHIESRARMIRHKMIQYPGLVHISREASPHADTIRYYSWNGSGTMIDIANRGNDYPFVEVSQTPHDVRIEWKGLAYDWSDREIGRAMLTGVPLADRKVRAAFRIWEEEKENVFLNGDSDKGWDGILNTANVTTTTSGGVWTSADDATIFNEVNRLIGSRWTATNKSRMCDTLLLPDAQFIELGRPMGNDANQSVFSYIQKYNAYTAKEGKPLMIRTVRELSTAGAGSTARAVAFPRDQDVIRFHVPQELQFIEPQRKGTTWIYHGHGVLAGLEVSEPTAMGYLDGI